MEGHKKEFHTIDEYIATFPADVQRTLNELRQVIKTAAPQAGEKISYQMPTFTLEGNLVHFAAYKKHIGFYPASSGIARFQQDLSAYKTSKGAVQFPIDQPIPYELVCRMVTFRVRENLERAAAKKKRTQ
ncbi:MAG: hypothetical protein GYA18_09320 [Chloroflexi bacterium]|nr:hypothetical protein [Chloroflexota bacterium]